MGQTDRHKYGTDRQTHKYMGQTDRHTHIWDRQTDTHMGQTDRQTDTHTYGTDIGVAPWCIGFERGRSIDRSRFESRSPHVIISRLFQPRNNNITRGKPLPPHKSYLEEKSKELKILLNGDWQSSLDRSTPTVET